jgi:dUTP pyrophosphatase
MNAPLVRLARLHPERDADLPLPRYQTAGAAGADLVAAVTAPVTLQPLERMAIPTGLQIALPDGFEGQVRARSGAALKRGLALPNAPGTIDSDYRGELLVAVVNLSNGPLVIERGDRIAQLVVAPVVQAVFALAESLDETARGDGGFGSTGR